MRTNPEIFALSKQISQHAYEVLLRSRAAIYQAELALQRAQSLTHRRAPHHTHPAALPLQQGPRDTVG